jgi:hypothetical protein
MNHKKTLYTGLVLALAVTALTGKVVPAEDLPPDSTAATHTRIVPTEATTTASQPAGRTRRAAHAEAQDAAVQAALQGVLADSKIELEMRLAGHNSELLTAGL